MMVVRVERGTRPNKHVEIFKAAQSNHWLAAFSHRCKIHTHNFYFLSVYNTNTIKKNGTETICFPGTLFDGLQYVLT